MTMSSLEESFEQAVRDYSQLESLPAGEDMLAIYSLYKQATVGDVQGERPPLTDFTARAKHDAWARLCGMSRDDAMQRYVDKVNALHVEFE
jgi:acyl-CoA-binding protein